MNSLTVLNNIEDRVVESINTAGKALNILSKSLDIKQTTPSIQEFKQLSDRYFNIVEKDVYKGLMEFVDSMTDVAPFDHSSYSNKCELDVSHNFTEIILLHLEEMEEILKEDIN
ncbi:putative mediator complex subunit 11 [Heterostelium album PN500]|uniref:Mediator of RNA polymerase II transcription subunit 11 n=1 Tax=Heterostelium pallidum (strain ATCC 26659 / Pp 5 / PN500) TaxID=670386 RepID=D3BHA3_HETP5|nr:putative mediator complex subunit 11 [Heterostelium album PN500]EFA79080.1 putative mediator complex subunit 11 [Heterostelium album PN500]|eukprot:XP_020431202.1 putative mediator complex subunit 11 [Heterostelium album PN500]